MSLFILKAETKRIYTSCLTPNPAFNNNINKWKASVDKTEDQPWGYTFVLI